MDKEEIKKNVLSDEEFRKTVYDIVFEQPMFTLMDLIQMGVVGTNKLKKIFDING